MIYDFDKTSIGAFIGIDNKNECEIEAHYIRIH